jgi:hypothetical protein
MKKISKLLIRANGGGDGAEHNIVMIRMQM